MTRRFTFTLCLLVTLSVCGRAQQPQVSFHFDNAQVKPNHYTLSVRQDGTADYESYDDDSMGEDEHYRRAFAVSADAREYIFAAAEKLGHFRGDFDYKKHKIAYTGKRTLTYSANGKTQSTSFIWTENQPLLQLAELMQGISITLEAEQRLRYLRRFDKLGLNAELASIEQRAERGWLKEIHLIAGCLQEIANDSSVVSIARTRATRLMKVAAAGPQPDDNAPKSPEKALN